MKGGTFLGLLPIGEVCRCSHQQVPGFLRTVRSSSICFSTTGVHRCSFWLRSCRTRRRYPWRLRRCSSGQVCDRCCADTCGDSTGAVLSPVCARCYADTCGDSTGAVLGPVVPVVTPTLVEIPQVQFSVQFVPVVTPTLVEIPQVQFFGKVYMSIVVSGAVGQTVQKTVEYPQLQFLDKVFISVVVVSGANGQTVQKTVEYPQLQFLDKVFFPSCCLVPMECRKLWSIHSCSSRTRH